MPDLPDGIEKAYRDAVAKKPYCSISVKDLCAQAGVTRKAFYKRLDGKGDILRTVFHRDIVHPAVELCELLSFEKMAQHIDTMERRMFQAVLDDADFYRALVAAPQGGREAFLEVATASFKSFNEWMLGQHKFSGEPWQVDYVTSFFADAKAHYFLRWIEGGFPADAEEASKLYSRMALPFWRSIR